MTAAELWQQHLTPNVPQAVEIARALLAEQGELTFADYHGLMVTQRSAEDLVALGEALDRVRQQHAQAHGRPAPEPFPALL